jgi:hypothetical protein
MSNYSNSTSTKKFVIKDPEAPITPAQTWKINDLMKKHSVEPLVQAHIIVDLPTMTKGTASNTITMLLTKPLLGTPAPAAAYDKPQAPVLVAKVEPWINWKTIEDKVYVGGSEKVYKVQTKKNGYKEIRRLTKNYKGEPSYTITNMLIAMKDIQDGGRLLTKEEAHAFGKDTNWCMCCGRKLTADVSVALSVGPICIKKMGWDALA